MRWDDSGSLASDNRWLYNGKEDQASLGLPFLDYGARMYDNRVGKWHSADALSEKFHNISPYAYVKNNPIVRIDPDGLTDFTINKKTGEVTQVGEDNDDPDRILKTNKKGEVKTKNNGEAKVAIDGIEKGILQDGQNFKTQDNIIAVGGEGQPSEQGVESFVLKLSEYVGREIGGGYFSKDGAENTTHMTIGRYENNRHDRTGSYGINFHSYPDIKNEYQRFQVKGIFHTHPSTGYSVLSRTSASRQDKKSRDEWLKMHPSLRVFILTEPVQYGDKYPYKIDYTTHR